MLVPFTANIIGDAKETARPTTQGRTGMTFGEAISTGFKKYADFTGRRSWASR
jgi:hypothetical protein